MPRIIVILTLLVASGLVVGAPALAKGSWTNKLKKAGYAGATDAVRELLGKIAAEGEAEGAEDILKAMPWLPAEEVLDDIISTFQVIGVEKLDPVFGEYLEKKMDKDPIGAAVIFRFAQDLSDPKSEAWIVSGAKSTQAITVRNALQAIQKRKPKSAIPILINQLGELNPKRYRMIIFEIEDALWELTGMEFDTIEDWQSWWEVNEATFDPSKVGKENPEKATGVRKKKRSKDAPEFFGVEVLSSKVMFVVDMSGSMQMWDPKKGEGGGASSWRERQRIQRVKAQLSRALADLKKSSKFNVIGFSDRLIKFNQKTIVPATGGQKKKAQKWVSGLNAMGLTHTDEALKEAFKDKEIDTIMLLSDGAPTKGQNGPGGAQLINQILSDVKKWNKIRKVKIFTFGFDGAGRFPPNSGQQGQPQANPAFAEFLQKLAKENGGSYISID